LQRLGTKDMTGAAESVMREPYAVPETKRAVELR
jgi:hypothetical protein